MYLATPEYLVAWSRRAVRHGARLVGGCCGTTPEHIRAMRTTLGEHPSEISARGKEVARTRTAVPRAAPTPRAKKSILASALNRGDFVRGVGIPAPLGWEGADVKRAVRLAALGGASFVSFAEGSRMGWRKLHCLNAWRRAGGRAGRRGRWRTGIGQAKVARFPT